MGFKQNARMRPPWSPPHVMLRADRGHQASLEHKCHIEYVDTGFYYIRRPGYTETRTDPPLSQSLPNCMCIVYMLLMDGLESR